MNNTKVATMMYDREDDCCEEAEDFMCDQVIFSSDVDFQAKQSNVAISTTKLRVAIEVLANALLPAVSTIYYAYMRNQKSMVENVRKILIPTVLAVLVNYLSQSLSSVQRRITTPRMVAIDNDANPNSQSNEDEFPEKSVECNVLTTPADIKTDIIFLHGLHGALEKTWKQGLWRHERHKINRQELTKSPSLGDIRIRGNLKRTNKNQPAYLVKKICKNSFSQSIDNSIREVDDDESQDLGHPRLGQGQAADYSPCWPLWLEKDCPGARVIALNYTTDPYLWRPIWVKKRNRTGMVERSKEMLEKLHEIGVGAHPIVWVGHSKGGLFIKQMLIDCSKSLEDCDRSIYEQSKAILFYSVPHRGSIMADISLPLLSKSIEVTEVQKNCKFVLELHDKFLKLFDDENFKPEVFSFIESSFTLMSFIYLKIVSLESADPGVGEICEVPLDHREICKPAGRDCFLYKELLHLIHKALKTDESIEVAQHL